MPFEKYFQNDYNKLDINTKYRFAEVEIAHALKCLDRLFSDHSGSFPLAVRRIYEVITPREMTAVEPWEDWKRATMSIYFRKPQKKEIITYMLLRGVSYKKLRDLTGVAYNTISKHRYGLPHYHPIFNHWNPYMLSRWEEIKPSLNLFNESLVHMQTPEEIL
jgi:hypothetical protein